jgi:hypothetical protein
MRPNASWPQSATDFSPFLASRSGGPVASDARAHVAGHRDEGGGGRGPLSPALHGDAFWVVASSAAEVGLIPSRVACAQWCAS